jgi:4-amino-4-deoxy-L-arabinose transferase-like glycosyltransferase
LFAGLLRWRGHPGNPVMQNLTRPPELGIAVGGIPLLLGAVLTGVGLYIGRTETDWARKRRRWLAWTALAVTWLPLVGILVAAVLNSPSPSTERAANGWWVWGPTQVAIYGTCFVTAIYLTVAKPDRERRTLYMLVFYLCTALATLSKGLLGFLLPGAVLFFYILLTREWRILKRAELIPGTLLFIAAGVPWYAGMLIEHTQQFWQRFFVHDHFKRLASGVHQIDTGSFEHFIRWLGYGLFPWSALVPAAFGQFFTGRGLRVDNDRGRARFLLLVWAALAFTLFTLSSTKFHHYTFPVVPPLALLVALAIDDALDREVPEPWPLYLVGSGVLVLVAWDMIYDPQVIKDMFTYKYERKWDGDAWNSQFRFWLTIISIPGMLGTVWLLVRNRVVRRISFGLIFLSALGMTIFGLNYYMPEISSTWSQKGVWDAYYSHCNRIAVPEDPAKREQLCAETGNWKICEHYDEKKRYCEEEAIAYKLNWRGETFYTQNEVLPLRDDQDWDSFIDRRDRQPFYGIMQRGRYHGGFKRSLPDRLKGDSCIVFKRNIKFILIKVPCTEEDEERARELFGEDLDSKPPDGGLPPK